MSQRRFPDPRYVFKQQMSTRQERHDGKLDDSGFALNHAGNVLLNGGNELSRFHGVEWPFLLR